jgi:hypothetical protein
MDMNQPTIRIRDLGLAAALVSCDFEMLRTDHAISGPAFFVFTQTPELERAVNDYWADTLDVKARKFFDDIKMLKSRIYSER